MRISFRLEELKKPTLLRRARHDNRTVIPTLQYRRRRTEIETRLLLCPAVTPGALRREDGSHMDVPTPVPCAGRGNATANNKKDDGKTTREVTGRHLVWLLHW